MTYYTLTCASVKQIRWHGHFWNAINSESSYKYHILIWINNLLSFGEYLFTLFYLSEERSPHYVHLKKRYNTQDFKWSLIKKNLIQFSWFFFNDFDNIITLECSYSYSFKIVIKIKVNGVCRLFLKHVNYVSRDFTLIFIPCGIYSVWFWFLLLPEQTYCEV